MQKIAIFGDSYAVSGFSESFNYQKTWADLLANEFETENFAQTGCGSDMQLQRFIKYFEQDRSDDIIVFVLPHHLRLCLTGIENTEHVYSFVYLHNKVKGISQKIKDRLKTLQVPKKDSPYFNYVKKYGNFLDLWYEYFLKSNTYLETEPLKIAALISKYRKFCKKIILLPVHPMELKNRNLLKEDNFVVSDLALRLLDESENYDNELIVKNNGIDTRAGHMNRENHINVFKHLKETINGKIYS